MNPQKYVVTGANSKIGRQVISFLLNDYNLPPNQLIATSRDLEKISYLNDLGVETRQADYANPASMEAAFAGADSLLLISMDVIGQRDKLHTNAVKAAEKAGVKFIAYTSMPSVEESPIVFAFEHRATEKAIAQSKIPNYTVLRNNWYFENLPELFASNLQTSTWLTASAEGRIAQISRSDLALAAAAVLFKSEAGKQTITLNGSESLTVDEIVKDINSVLNMNVNVIHMTEEGLKEQLTSIPLPAEAVSFSASFEAHNRQNLSDGTSDAFEILTGQKPKTFKNWLKENESLVKAAAKA